MFSTEGLGDGPPDPPCELDGDCPPAPPPETFQPGPDPSDAILCQIPKPLADGDDGCATPAEAADPTNISLSEAATALVNGEFKSFALDFSDSAKLACGGLPKKIEFFGEFPDGLRVCINCGEQMPDPYATLTKACVAKCEDLVAQNGIIPDEGASVFCAANATLATNHQDTCYEGACTIGGSSNLAWPDPRKTPEPVKWTDHIGTQDGGTNGLERFAPTTGTTTADFNAGAASEQIITQGDAWVEFSAINSTAVVHVLGVRESLDSVGMKCFHAADCPDTDPHIETVGFAIDLNSDSQVYVLEPGATPGTFDVISGLGPYSVDERYRVRITDNHNGTATISYERKVGSSFAEFYKSTTKFPQYPLRVDTTFREQGAIIADVTIVRIK
jgi:hypothetical protein